MKFSLTFIIIAFISMQSIFGQGKVQNIKQSSYQKRYKAELIKIDKIKTAIYDEVYKLKINEFAKNKNVTLLVRKGFDYLKPTDSLRIKQYKFAYNKKWKQAYLLANKKLIAQKKALKKFKAANKLLLKENPQKKYKKEYLHKINIIASTTKIIASTLNELHLLKYEENKVYNKQVENILERLRKGKKLVSQYKNFAQKKQWKQALKKAEEYWMEQIFCADKLFIIKKNLKNKKVD